MSEEWRPEKKLLGKCATWVSNINPVTWTKLTVPTDWTFQAPLDPDITSTFQAKQPGHMTGHTNPDTFCTRGKLKQLNITANQ